MVNRLSSPKIGARQIFAQKCHRRQWPVHLEQRVRVPAVVEADLMPEALRALDAT